MRVPTLPALPALFIAPVLATLLALPLAAQAGRPAPAPAPATRSADERDEWLERTFDPQVRIDETLATVWTQYDFHLAGKFSHCGVDAFHLLKTATGWKIVSLADTSRMEGCPQRASP